MSRFENYIKSSEFIGDMYAFVRESNKIEDIHRDPTSEEISVSMDIIKQDNLKVSDVENFVFVCTNGARLRRNEGDNVRIGRHFPPVGGPEIERQLELLIKSLNTIPKYDPYMFHIQYESLHPFQDGNGRSGRILWAWQMIRSQFSHNGQYDIFKLGIKLGFLHTFYYQSLDASRR